MVWDGAAMGTGGRCAVDAPPLLARIHAEERLLRAQFGAAYDAYRAGTSRMIPGL